MPFSKTKNRVVSLLPYIIIINHSFLLTTHLAESELPFGHSEHKTVMHEMISSCRLSAGESGLKKHYY
ncbi:MAG: hypothetical protein J6X26_02050 [Bacteroidales bacterium]|nr:hypothetical protein [Bacteroidales bacterium]